MTIRKVSVIRDGMTYQEVAYKIAPWLADKLATATSTTTTTTTPAVSSVIHSLDQDIDGPWYVYRAFAGYGSYASDAYAVAHSFVPDADYYISGIAYQFGYLIDASFTSPPTQDLGAMIVCGFPRPLGLTPTAYPDSLPISAPGYRDANRSGTVDDLPISVVPYLGVARFPKGSIPQMDKSNGSISFPANSWVKGDFDNPVLVRKDLVYTVIISVYPPYENPLTLYDGNDWQCYVNIWGHDGGSRPIGGWEDTPWIIDWTHSGGSQYEGSDWYQGWTPYFPFTDPKYAPTVRIYGWSAS